MSLVGLRRLSGLRVVAGASLWRREGDCRLWSYSVSRGAWMVGMQQCYAVSVVAVKSRDGQDQSDAGRDWV